MPVPRASANRLPQLDLMSLLPQLFNGAFGPQQQDGLRALSVNNRAYPTNLWGPALVQWFSQQDAHTPDKLNQERLDEMYQQFPGSQFSNWLSSIGAAPGRGPNTARAGLYNAALGHGGGGGGGSQWWNPARQLGRLF